MIFTIFKKELKDTLRDRRTFMTMIVIPVLIFPVILNLFVGVSESYSKESATKKVKIGIVSEGENSISIPFLRPHFLQRSPYLITII